MKQVDIFAGGEAKAWLERNRDKMGGRDDIVSVLIDRLKLIPTEHDQARVVEVGCADGWRLQALRRRYSFNAFGIDPGVEMDTIVRGVTLYPGVAHDLGRFLQQSVDLLIYGFCLYLVDREDLFAVVAEADRVLCEGGHLIIHDFSDGPYSMDYSHHDCIRSYHMDHSRLWLANPAYRIVSVLAEPRDSITATVMRKDVAHAFPGQ